MTKQFNTRKPSGIQSSPVILLAGVAGAGKTWAAVEATAVPEVDRAFFIEIGEGVADAYGAVPGADFEIIEHDGSIGQIRDAIRWASEQPAEPEKRSEERRVGRGCRTRGSAELKRLGSA